MTTNTGRFMNAESPPADSFFPGLKKLFYWLRDAFILVANSLLTSAEILTVSLSLDRGGGPLFSLSLALLLHMYVLINVCMRGSVE